MNIRDIIFINKAKSSDRIKILDLLGFETDTEIIHNPEHYRISNKPPINLKVDTLDDDLGDKVISETSSSIESYIRDLSLIHI